MTAVRQWLLAWLKVSTLSLIAALAACSLLGSLAFLHRVARHPGPVNWHDSLLASEYHFVWVWGGRIGVLFIILSSAVLAHALARLTQYSFASLRQRVD
jgi:hypothetical protein